MTATTGAEATQTERLLAAFDEHMRSQDRAAGTRKTFSAAAKRFADWFAASPNRQGRTLLQVTSKDVLEHKAFLIGQRRKTATINLRITSLHALYAYTVSAGLRADNPVDGVRREREQPQPPKSLGRAEVNSLRRAAVNRIALADDNRKPKDITPTAAIARRDNAILMTFLGTGVRLAELCAIELDDVTMTTRNGQLRIRGKGGKTRHPKLNPEVRAAIQTWLDVRPTYLAARTEEGQEPTAALFASRSGGFLSHRVVGQMLSALAEEAKLEPGSVSPHTLRHTFSKEMVSSQSIEKVQAALGHANLNTTARYIKPTDEDMQAAFDAVSWME